MIEQIKYDSNNHDLAQKVNEIAKVVNNLNKEKHCSEKSCEKLANHSGCHANLKFVWGEPKQEKPKEDEVCLEIFPCACKSYQEEKPKECGCACHDNKLKKPYTHDSKCCESMNGYLPQSDVEEVVKDKSYHERILEKRENPFYDEGFSAGFGNGFNSGAEFGKDQQEEKPSECLLKISGKHCFTTFDVDDGPAWHQLPDDRRICHNCIFELAKVTKFGGGVSLSEAKRRLSKDQPNIEEVDKYVP